MTGAKNFETKTQEMEGKPGNGREEG